MQDTLNSHEVAYPDFVGYINQWNVLPGAYSTLNEWAIFSRLNAESSLLQLGCTTGFQARELAVLTGCSAHGIDLSSTAVEAANWNAINYAPQSRLSYDCCDAVNFTTSQKYTHIAVGAGLRFFSDPEAVLNRMPDWLDDGGYLLASPFFVRSPIPDHLIELGQKVFGIVPTLETYDDVIAPYTRFETVYESRKEIALESEHQIRLYCQSTIERAARYRQIDNRAHLDELFERLFEVRRASNELRPYQGYAVMVLRYRKSTYPHRYVELF